MACLRFQQFDFENDRPRSVGATGEYRAFLLHPGEAAAEPDVCDVPLDVGVGPGAEALGDLARVEDILLAHFVARADGVARRRDRRFVPKRSLVESVLTTVILIIATCNLPINYSVK